MSTASVNINFSVLRVKAHLGCNLWSLWFSEEFAPKGGGSLSVCSAASACGLRPQTVKVTTIILCSTLEQTILIKDLPLSWLKAFLPSVNKQVLQNCLSSQLIKLAEKLQTAKLFRYCKQMINAYDIPLIYSKRNCQTDSLGHTNYT